MDMIDLLETVGRDASLRAASQEELRQALRCAASNMDEGTTRPKVVVCEFG